jgi:hypothetical protein
MPLVAQHLAYKVPLVAQHPMATAPAALLRRGDIVAVGGATLQRGMGSGWSGGWQAGADDALGRHGPPAADAVLWATPECMLVVLDGGEPFGAGPTCLARLGQGQQHELAAAPASIAVWARVLATSRSERVAHVGRDCSWVVHAQLRCCLVQGGALADHQNASAFTASATFDCGPCSKVLARVSHARVALNRGSFLCCSH